MQTGELGQDRQAATLGSLDRSRHRHCGLAQGNEPLLALSGIVVGWAAIRNSAWVASMGSRPH